jgi:hypothetical protein
MAPIIARGALLVSTDAVVLPAGTALDNCPGVVELRAVGSDLVCEAGGDAFIVFRARLYAVLEHAHRASEPNPIARDDHWVVTKIARHGNPGTKAEAAKDILKCLAAGKDLECVRNRRRLLSAGAAVREGHPVNAEVITEQRVLFRWDDKRRLVNRDVNPFAGVSRTEPYATLDRMSAADRLRTQPNGKRRRRHQRRPRDLLGEVFKRLAEGQSVREVARATGVPKSTIHDLRHRFVGDKSPLLERWGPLESSP